jgi:hypothetical protein
MAVVIRRLTSGDGSVPEVDRKHLRVLQAAVADKPDSPSASLPLQMIARFAPVPASLLRRVGAELLRAREEDLKQTLESHAAILARYEGAAPGAAGRKPAAKPAIPRGYRRDAEITPINLPGSEVYRYEGKPAAVTPAQRREVGRRVQPAADATGMTATLGALFAGRCRRFDGVGHQQECRTATRRGDARAGATALTQRGRDDAGGVQSGGVHGDQQRQRHQLLV